MAFAIPEELRMLRDSARSRLITEVSSEMQRMFVAREMLPGRSGSNRLY